MTLDFATLDTLRIRARLRLEQEYIGFHWLGNRLQRLLDPRHS